MSGICLRRSAVFVAHRCSPACVQACELNYLCFVQSSGATVSHFSRQFHSVDLCTDFVLVWRVIIDKPHCPQLLLWNNYHFNKCTFKWFVPSRVFLCVEVEAPTYSTSQFFGSSARSHWKWMQTCLSPPQGWKQKITKKCLYCISLSKIEPPISKLLHMQTRIHTRQPTASCPVARFPQKTRHTSESFRAFPVSGILSFLGKSARDPRESAPGTLHQPVILYITMLFLSAPLLFPSKGSCDWTRPAERGRGHIQVCWCCMAKVIPRLQERVYRN